MMVGTDLAEAIRVAMGFPTPVSAQLIGWSNAVVQHVQTGIVNNTSGTVTGDAPPSGGSLSNGAADNGMISGLNGPTLANLVATMAGYGYVTSQLTIFCNEIVSHIMTLGRVEFASGDIQGSCSNTLLSPGVLTGTGADGFIKSLNGPVLAQAIHDAIGYPGSLSARLTQFCTAIVNYIMDNAVVAYASVTGVCPAGGGAITAGTASGGTIA